MSAVLSVPALYGKAIGRNGDTTVHKVRCTSPISLPVNQLTQIDLSQQEGTNAQSVDICQTLYVDNGGNAGALAITLDSGQIIQFPANSQGYVEVLQGVPIRFTINNPAGGSKATVQIINEKIPSYIWAATAL